LGGFGVEDLSKSEDLGAQLRVLVGGELDLQQGLLVLGIELSAACGEPLAVVLEFLLSGAGCTLRRSMKCLSLAFSERMESSPWTRAASSMICIS
jgi:hypothetical protein